ncbi:MAG: phosphoglycerol geranylgeranyltransferase [Candidatus Marinimicrobia bacterium]|nr:phosphoglycerol geranylgeranyltransferase [Candidatus Neomarinimicrobiota bacterium]
MNSISDSKPSVIGLIDPDKKNHNLIKNQLRYINENDFCSVLVGGSLLMDSNFDDRINYISSKTNLPLISFPSSSSQLHKKFDAILFLSLISGRNPQYLIGEHVNSAPIIHSLGIESIPVGYILIDGGGLSSVELMSNTRSLPMEKVDIIIAHALASQYLGHKFIYLECGSGAKNAIDLNLLQQIKKTVSIPLIVGGGVKNKDDIKNLYNSGADLIVVGTMIEQTSKQ